MKPVLVILLAVLSISAHSQIKTDSLRPIQRKSITPVKTQVMTKQQDAASKGIQTKPGDTQPTLTDADYFLAGAVLKITTGADNKEPNTSSAFFFVRPRKTNGQQAYKLEEYVNEIKANELTTLRLDRATTLTSAQNSLQYFKQNGLSVVVAYANKYYCTDAWRIENITITLEFKDVNGNPAPGGYASKTINFPVSSATLGFVFGCNPLWVTSPDNFFGYSDQKLKMILKTDQYFNPLPAILTKWREDDVN
jgi:hypothetical protein